MQFQPPARAEDKAKLVELLKELQNPDNAKRKQAEGMYQQAKAADPDSLVTGMLGVVCSADCEESVRRHGSVLLRQCVKRGEPKDFLFPKLRDDNKKLVAQQLLTQFEQEQLPKIQSKIGDVICKLMEYVCDPDDPRASLNPGQAGAQAWPGLLEKLFEMGNVGGNPRSAESCENALRLIRDMVPTLKADIVRAQQQLGAILQSALGCPSLKMKVAAVLIINEIVQEADKKAWAPLLGTVAVCISVLRELAQASEEDLLQECIQSFIDTALTEPDFFKAQMQQAMEPGKFMAEVARSQGVEPGLRNMALEWMVSWLEKKVKFCSKSLKTYPGMVLEACMQLMLEVEDGEAELKTWASRMDDEEGAEDEDELYHYGEEAIDRVVEAMGMEDLSTALFQLIGNFVGQDKWQAKHAALAAIKQTVEYVEEKPHVDEMAKLLLQHVDHAHPRVRYTSLHAIGQLANDQSPHFQESSHRQVMPMLLNKMDDPIDRVSAMSMSAFVSFGEELEQAFMIEYSVAFMQKLIQKLQASQHRGVREESITSIAVIAGVIEKDFAQYYDGIMPMLKQFVMTATGDKERRLRGKAFECMSLLGIAVGKEKFLPDAREALQAMMATQTSTTTDEEDILREYIKEASERICQCLKKDFAPFLQHLLPGIFKTLELSDAVSGPAAVNQDEDDYIKVSTGDGKVVSVRTQRFEEMMQSAQLLHTFCSEVETAYFDYVQPSAQAILPLLQASDEMSVMCDEVRGICLQTWALLIKVAKQGAAERSQGPEMAKQLLSTAMELCVKTFNAEDGEIETSNLSEVSCAFTECIKNAGAGMLTAQETQQTVTMTFSWIDRSMVRGQKAAAEKNKNKQESVQVGLGDDDEEDYADPVEEEEQLRRNFEELLGALMEVSPQEFLNVLTPVSEKIKMWISQPDNVVLGLYLACDLLKHLKDRSQPAWPVFFPKVMECLSAKEPDQRTAAFYAINLAAKLGPAFPAEAAQQAYQKIAQYVHDVKPKKRDDKEKLAYDNSVATLFTLSKDQAAHCPPAIQGQSWPLVLSKLPLTHDKEEAQIVHEMLVQLVMEQNAGLLGQDACNLGKILKVLAEIYKVENQSKKELDEKILQIFKMIPRDKLMACAPEFSEKQQKKIEKMLSS